MLTKTSRVSDDIPRHGAHTSNTIPRLHAWRTRSLMFVPECGGRWGLSLKQGQYYMDWVWAESGTPTEPEVAQARC
ncbi:hypothetical protein VNO77_27596 [Canavalia gladiata]|uniref:Uncharacterized protein n=1 Tax=Canavalia gladiata TaxID=3824 RepID=A0AAN9Q6L8_CANGL